MGEGSESFESVSAQAEKQSGYGWNDLPQEARWYLEQLETAGKRRRKELMRDIMDGLVPGLEPPESEQPLNLPHGVINVNRTTKVTKGGKVFSFAAMVVVGNRDGVAGYGYGKGPEASSAIKKAANKGSKNLFYIPRADGRTLFHQLEGRYEATKVLLFPEHQGAGQRAGKTISTICDLAGIKDVGGKVIGSRNAINTVKAIFQALDEMRTPEEMARESGRPIVRFDSHSRPLSIVSP